MTHVRNVEAFEGFVGRCTGFGDKYNPGSPKLRLDALSVLLVNARKTLASVHEMKTEYDRVTNEREIFFRNLPRLAASVILTLDASGVKAETLHDARGFYRMLLGRRAKVKALEATPEGEEPRKGPRVAQLSYESKADHFARLVQLVSASPLYMANEPELSVPGLKATVKKLYSLNSGVVKAKVALKTANLQRNETLYKTNQAIYVVGRSAKKYVRAIFGHDSEEFNQVRSYVFTKPNYLR